MIEGRVPEISEWRRWPVVLQRAVPEQLVDEGRYRSWCRVPVETRLYQLRENDKAGSAIALDLPEPEYAPVIFDRARQTGDEVTVLLNGVEKVEPDFLARVKGLLPAGPDWRSDDLVSTWSTVNSGIGFHAGHEDGYVVQCQGARRWRVWDKTTLSGAYLRFLMGEGTDEYAVVPERPTKTAPIIDVTLEPGDALYIPANFPHEGVTTRESISLSVAWRGFSAFTLLRRFYGNDVLSSMTELARVDRNWFELLADPPVAADVVAHLVAEAAAVVDLDALGVTGPELRRRMTKRLVVTGSL